jgi:PEP-CTERM motif-containing protein
MSAFTFRFPTVVFLALFGAALTGHIAAFPNRTATIPLFEVDVIGSGLATLLLDRSTSGTYFFTAADYTIQDPVPEPATLLLFGSGITTLLIRRRHTRDDCA